MPELLLFAWDHSTRSVPKPSTKQIAALPKCYDLIAWRDDGWKWGREELAHPWFRVMSCPGADPRELDALLSPLLPARGPNLEPLTLEQYRSHYLDIGAAPAQWRAWFDDHARANALLAVPPIDIPALKKARPAIAIPPGGIPAGGL
jgi:hypothetical protein